MKDSTETRIGMFFALAVIAALVILESLGSFAFLSRGYHLRATFKNVEELKVGDPVKMGGVVVGRVERIGLTNTFAEVTMNLDRTATNEVRTDSKAAIKFAGLLGQNYVSIDFGSPTGVPAVDGTVLQPIEEPDLSALMGKIDNVATGVENLTKSFSGEQINELFGPLTELVKNNQSNLTAIVANVRAATDHIGQGRGTVGRLIYSDDLHSNAVTTLAGLQDTATEIKRAAAEGRALVANANDIVNQVKTGKGSIGKFLNDPGVYNELASAVTNLNHILQKMDSGQGTLGGLINDDSTLKNVKLSLQKLDKATESLEDTGPMSILGTMMNSLF